MVGVTGFPELQTEPPRPDGASRAGVGGGPLLYLGGGSVECADP